jgi:superfamily I DNA/RNA helicase
MIEFTVTDVEIEKAEKAILPDGKSFTDEQKIFLRYPDSCDVQAYAGTGKTTMLVAKTHILAQKEIWKSGRGICIVSHTNVAVDEIKERVAIHYPKVLQHPNFVGTLQEFANKFLFSPYLAGKGLSIKFQDEMRPDTKQAYVDAKTNKIVHDDFTKGKRAYKNQAEYNSNDISTHWETGRFIFPETFEYGLKYLEDNPIVSQFLSQRFSHVFLDEAQDCSKEQIDLFDRLFRDSGICFQRIGDKNQSIIKNEWQPCEGSLELSETMRFDDSHSKFVTHFKVDDGGGLKGDEHAGAVKCVVLTHSGKLNELGESIFGQCYELISATEVKGECVMCAFTNDTLTDLHPLYAKLKQSTTKTRYTLQSLTEVNKSLIMEHGVRVIYDCLVGQLKIMGKTERESGDLLRYKPNRSLMLDFAREVLADGDVNPYIQEIQDALKIDQEVVEKHLMKKKQHNRAGNEVDNIYKKDGYPDIKLQTIHASKGQTHDATILIVDKRNRYNPVLNKDVLSDGEKENRKKFYVAASRPKSLFVVVMKEDQFNNVKTSLKEIFGHFEICKLVE